MENNEMANPMRYRVTCAMCFVTGLTDDPPAACAHCGSTMLLVPQVPQVPTDHPPVHCEVVTVGVKHG